MRTKLVIAGLVLTLTALPFVSAFAQKPKPIVIKSITWGKLSSSDVHYFKRVMEEVNKRSDGQLVIDYAGGPEVIPAKDQGSAVSSGVIDMVSFPFTRVKATVPEVDAIGISSFSWAEERKNGWQDYFRKALAERMNIYGVKIAINKYSPFMLFLNKKISSPKELTGLKLRSSSTYIAFLRDLGIVPVDMPPSEMYTAVERGVVDGFAYDAAACVRFQMFEVVKYYINHPFWYGNVSLFMNMKKWNSLPKNLQDLITNIVIELEPEIERYLKDEQNRSVAKMNAEGMKPITFSSADAAYFIGLSEKSQLNILKKNCTPEQYKKITSLLGK
ncbi:MAG: TRAP transporter substrate-binding protein DctP [Pseudomonadota bacterium]